ncbi:Ketosteroid isomerase-related protein [Janthinobacterium sp. CG23_2]|nr:Ketosteroid isomerase-related protein [Janthinobacterium sp. CG23_2]CUU31241.1 Ketosteroid isomerase-related protein [Janthinobacterium sp. CG23_2]
MIVSPNLEMLRSTYEGQSGENATRLLDLLAADAEWVEAAGFPYAGTFRGPDAIVANVFRRLATEWIGYRAEADSFLEQGEQIAAFGSYSGTYKETGRAMRAAFAHHYTFRDGKIARMVQYVDSYTVRQAMQP